MMSADGVGPEKKIMEESHPKESVAGENRSASGDPGLVRPLFVDLDGTLIQTDLLHEAILTLAFRAPRELLGNFWGTRHSRAALKQQLARVVHPLGLGTGSSLLLASLGAVSFSQLIGGSVPEHFALGGFCVTASLLLAATELRDGRSPLSWAWLALGTLATGTTVTQIIPTLLLMVASGIGSGWTWRNAVRQVVVVGVCAGLLTYGSAFALNRLLPPRESVGKASVPSSDQHAEEKKAPSAAASKVWTLREILSHHGRWVVRFLRLDANLREQLTRVPEVLVNTLSPPRFDTQLLNRGQIQRGRYDFGFTLEKTGQWVTMAIVPLLLVTGLIGSRYGSRGQRFVTLAAAGILLFNMVFHSLWGQEFFLYSQHWLVAQIVLLAGNLAYPSRTRRALCQLFVILFPVVAFRNANLIWSMLQQMDGI
jgi:hypothetical protein